MRVCTQSGKDTADVCTLQSICNLYAEKPKLMFHSFQKLKSGFTFMMV